ncbi:MAG: hypothetical protein WCO54_01650 [Bacteroidota bacterium]
MLKNRNILSSILAVIFAGVIILSGCVKDVTVIKKPTVAVISRPVSFSKEILPILTTSCAKAGCHALGGHVPILTADKAYSSLINDPDFIKTDDPENSQVYLRLTGKIVPAMPMDKPGSDPSSINELVLAWIKQGAKNN